MHSVIVFKQRKDLDASDTNLQQWTQKHQSQACFHLKWLAVAMPSIFLATSKES